MTNDLKPDDRRGNSTSSARGSEGPPDLVGRYGKWLVIGAWILVIAVGTWAADRWMKNRDARRAAVVLEAGGSAGEGIKLIADRYGHFVVTGYINGAPVEFLVDTGASGISIPERIAIEIGLERGMPYRVSTANGDATVYSTMLDSLAIGPLIEAPIRAHINPGMDDTALLGMSFLRQFELIQRDGELTIREPSSK